MQHLRWRYKPKECPYLSSLAYSYIKHIWGWIHFTACSVRHRTDSVVWIILYWRTHSRAHCCLAFSPFWCVLRAHYIEKVCAPWRTKKYIRLPKDLSGMGYVGIQLRKKSPFRSNHCRTTDQGVSRVCASWPLTNRNWPAQRTKTHTHYREYCLRFKISTKYNSIICRYVVVGNTPKSLSIMILSDE